VGTFISGNAQTQDIVWGEPDEHDSPRMPFEIIGRFDSSYFIYKSVRNNNYICVYNENMEVIYSHELEFLPSSMLDLDIIRNKKSFTLIWQEQQGGIVSCYGAVLSKDFGIIVAPQLLDTTRVGQFADKKIYLTACSEDKSKWLVYKRYVQKGTIRVMAKVYDQQFSLLDSARFSFDFKSRKDFLSTSVVDNEGNVYFTAQHRESNNAAYTELSLFVCSRKTGVNQTNIDLHNKRLLQTSLAVDNNNKRCIITADYSDNGKYRSDGIFVCYINAFTHEIHKQHFVVFSDSVKKVLKPSGGNAYEEEDFHPDFILVKKNGAVVIVREDAYEETINNMWNNGGMMAPGGFTTPGDYYYNPYYSNSFYNRNFNRPQTRYFNNNVNVIQIDSSLQNQWLRVVSKNQYSEEDENSSSFFLMMQSRELHLVYIPNQNQRNIIAHVGLGGDGTVKRYPTFRGNGSSLEALPRFGRQTSSGSFIMPYITGSKLGFAKVSF
jgi:hypothetical protein